MYARRFLLLFIFIFLCLIALSYQINKGKDLRVFRFLSSPLNTLNNLTTGIIRTIKEPFRIILLRDRDLRRLEAEIKKLLLERQQYREIFLENQRLREILSLKEREKGYVTAARVISKGLDPFSDTMVINKGKLDGIAKDMAVITPKGLVGKIAGVSDRYSTVLLLSDTSFSAAIKIQDTRKDAIVSGNGYKGCILKYIGYEDVVKEGDTIITSGFDDLFPEGIPVGYVSKVSKKESGFFQAIEVKPFQNLTALDEVTVVKR